MAEVTQLTESSSDPSIMAVRQMAVSSEAFGGGRLAEARAAWHGARNVSTEYQPVFLARSARAAIWLKDAPAALADLAILEDSGGHGPAVEADRTTIRGGLAALDGRAADARSLYREALLAWRDLGLAWDEALCGLDMALFLDPSEPEVQAATASAREILVRLEARPFIARLEAALARPSGGGELELADPASARARRSRTGVETQESTA
jgi:hypothetical protein